MDYFYVYNGAGVWLGFERVPGVGGNDPTELTFNWGDTACRQLLCTVSCLFPWST